MVYSTYLGGSYLDAVTGIAVDRQGNAYVTGYTYSNDFPVTPGAFQSKTSAAYAAFVAKIGPDGGTLVYSTYLSGSWQDAAFGIALDGAGSAYLTGFAGSPDFPSTPGALHAHGAAECSPATSSSPATYNPGSAFAAKLSADGGTLLYSALAGGSCGEQGQGIAVDASGTAYVVGTTLSTDFPLTTGALQSTTGIALSTGFLMKLSPQGGLLSSTLIGGPFGSTAGAVALDLNGNPYLTGCTSGFDDERFATGSGLLSGVFLLPGAGGPVGSLSGLLVGAPYLPSAGINASCAGAAYALKLNAAGSSRSYLIGVAEPNFHALLMRIDGAVTKLMTVADSSSSGNGVAPGEIVVLTGSGLGPAQAVGPEVTGGRVATSLAGTTVTFDGVPAPLLSVQAGRIVCVVPFAVHNSSNTTTMQVSSGGALSNNIVLAAVSTQVEILSVVNQDGTLNSASHPASAGSIVTMYASGFGQTAPPSVDGQVNGGRMRMPLAGSVNIGVAGESAEILYSGPAPGQVAGVYQINFRIPRLDPGQYQTSLALDTTGTFDSYGFVTVNLAVGN